VEVMMAGANGTRKAAAGNKDVPTKSGRTAQRALERKQNKAGTSAVPPTSTPLQAAMDKLSAPVAPDADVTTTQTELEA
jgi:hypothetical protein